MDKELQLIAHLYDEASEEQEPLRELLRDPEMASEYQALSEARFALDHRVHVRPRPSVVNAVIREATRQSGSLEARADRPPLRRITFNRRSLVGGLALAAALALTVMVQPWSLFSGSETIPVVADNPFDFAVPAESLLGALPPVTRPLLTGSVPGSPGWDSGNDVRQLSRRIRSLQAAGVAAWDESSVPLEMLTPGASSGLTPAGIRR
jgi:hypothetical protein